MTEMSENTSAVITAEEKVATMAAQKVRMSAVSRAEKKDRELVAVKVGIQVAWLEFL